MKISVTRGSVVESLHHVDGVVVGPGGPPLAWGDPDRPTLARSGLKLVQALPLVRSGAADRFELSPEELVLACASHSAEPGHVEAVATWLDRIGLEPTDLECGAALPRVPDQLGRHLASGRGPEAIFNNCSGKHAGFLTLARHLGVDPAGYIQPEHPVQELVTGAIEVACGVGVADQTPGRDGCGIPTWSVPLVGLARSMAALAAGAGDGDPAGGDSTPASSWPDPSWGEAATRVVDAVAPRPWWISGTDRHEVVMAGHATEPLVLKAGAEGVFMGALPERGLGFAVKAADGAARAAEVAVAAVLAHLGALPGEAVAQPVHNVAGLVVGSIEADETTPTARG